MDRTTILRWRDRLLAVALIALASAAAAVEPWPHFRGDLPYTGRTDRVSRLGPTLLWSARTSGSIVGSPVMDSSGTLYVAAASGHVHAFDREGTRRWAFATSASLFGSPTLAPDATIHVGDLAGRVYALRPDGTLRWVYQITNSGRDARVIQAPGIGPEGNVYVCAWDGRLHAFGPGGAHLWGVSLGGYLSASPAVDTTGTIYVVGYSDDDLRVYARRTDGTSKWTFARDMGSTAYGAFATYIKSSVCVDEARGRLYVAANCPDGGWFACLDLRTGAALDWRAFPRAIYSAPSVGPDGAVFFGALDGRLYAYDPDRKTVKWSFQTDGEFIFGSPLVDGDGSVYVGASDGCLYKVGPTGREVWRFATAADVRATPLIDAAGVLYFASHDSRLYAIGGVTRARAWRRYDARP